jgi:hypothetical protein
MPAPYQWSLTPDQESELVRTRDHAQEPYLRERAAILLQIAHGLSIRAAAQVGGLKPHHRDSVCGWVARYRSEGLGGLRVRRGRGRKPASFPGGKARRPKSGGGST